MSDVPEIRAPRPRAPSRTPRRPVDDPRTVLRPSPPPIFRVAPATRRRSSTAGGVIATTISDVSTARAMIVRMFFAYSSNSTLTLFVRSAVASRIRVASFVPSITVARNVRPSYRASAANAPSRTSSRAHHRELYPPYPRLNTSHVRAYRFACRRRRARQSSRASSSRHRSFESIVFASPSRTSAAPNPCGSNERCVSESPNTTTRRRRAGVIVCGAGDDGRSNRARAVARA